MYADNLAQLQIYYDENAPKRERSTMQDWKKVERQHFLSYLQRERAETLLEIGAGVGRDSLFFQENGLAIVCTDLSAEMIAHCRAKGLNAQQLDFLQLSQLDQVFDAIYAVNCLLHVAEADLPEVLSNIKQQLKPDGLFYYGVYGSERSEGMSGKRGEALRFFSFYPDEEIQAIVQQQFKLVEFRRVAVPETDDFHFQSMILRKS